MGVKILPKKFPSGWGYDLQVLDEEVTVQDYLDALNKYIIEGNLTRKRGHQGFCEGCDTCCAEPIPLTSIDIYRLQQGLKEQGLEVSWEQIIKRYTYVRAEGPVVDITLGQDAVGKCLFLDKELGKCTIYEYRPLVCQTYICAPVSRRAEALREIITNVGEDELVKWCLDNIPEEQLYHEWWEPQVRREDWQDTPFNNKLSYGEVRLKELCSPWIWKKLRG